MTALVKAIVSNVVHIGQSLLQLPVVSSVVSALQPIFTVLVGLPVIRDIVNSTCWSEILNQPTWVLWEHALVLALLYWVWSEMFTDGIVTTIVRGGYWRLKRLPIIRGIIAKEKAKAMEDMRKHSAKPDDPKFPRRFVIPPKGENGGELLKYLQSAYERDCAKSCDYTKGRAFGYVYGLDAHAKYLCKVYEIFSQTNPLHTNAFPSVQQMEADVVRMTAAMLNGSAETVHGTMSSGGTESLLLAVKAYRDRARELWPQIHHPNLIVPNTIHAAVDKGGVYFNVKIIHVDVGKDFRANVRAMKKAVNSNTIGMFISAVCYPYGVVDPVEELAAFCQKRGLPLHVDACLGGFMLPWVERLGYPVPPFDFRVPGVSSMSADVHKYGYAAKGASTIMYRKSMDLLRFQFYSYANWPGGLYATPTFAGSRPGGIIAAAWASLVVMGEAGYLELAKKVMGTTRLLTEGIDNIPGLHILGQPAMTGFAFASDTLNVLMVADAMSDRGWSIERQQKPTSIHCSVTTLHIGHEEEFLDALRDSVAEVRNHPEKFESGMAAIYGGAARMPDRSLVEDVVASYFERMYS